MPARVNDTVGVVRELHRSAGRIPWHVDLSTGLTSPHLVALLVEGLEDTVNRREDPRIGTWQFEEGCVATLWTGCFRRKHAEMGKHISRATAADFQRLDRYRSAAGHFGRDGGEPSAAGGSCRGARFPKVADHHSDGRVKR